jgi:NADH:ubiquinone oxidoreductase subunit 5 (subunit L)/multisubunit Na+/H+ antiporter MnhA subunit
MKGNADPMEWSLGGFYKVLKNKYYIDEFYTKVFIKPTTWFAEKIVYAWMDLKIIDGSLHGLKNFGLWIGNILRQKIDTPIINRGGDKLAKSTRLIGSEIRLAHTGKVQDYMFLALAFSIVGGLIFLIIIY